MIQERKRLTLHHKRVTQSVYTAIFMLIMKRKKGEEIEKRQKFSIRKYKVGTFSVVVGALFYLNGISNMVQATEISETSVPTSVEEKQSEENKKAEEPQQPKVQ